MKWKGTYRRIAAFMTMVLTTVLLAGCSDVVVLNPKGSIGQQQMDLILISTVLCLIVVVPVLVLTFWIAWRYRKRDKNQAAYQPNWDHSTKLETIWWGIPIIIIAVLAVITVQYTYKLEPSKPIEHEAEPIVIQVTSLDWKWMFLYPEQGIATVNYLKFPANRPVRFELTSDAPMNSFWIPQLGGQIYTMSGMAMKLNLIADEPGEYKGAGANFSGKDFGQMNFVATATSDADFEKWVADVKKSYPALTKEGYVELAKPGTSLVRSFSSFPKGLFNDIVMKYQVDGSGHHHGGGSEAASGAKEEGVKTASGAQGASDRDMSAMAGHDMSAKTDQGMTSHNHNG
ncbi:ubiquinol oxidase subunit II [Cohnella sp. REN36]|uniref:ubiquinol oxidase subunit II n=1 Tax=Cohnella sp. REN36 TaxID=2887347 RepID=UPI00351D2A32